VSEIVVNVLEITCSYATEPVLKDIQFAIRKGDFLGIIGPNGSGKSTLLKTISRVLKPLQGSVHLRGINVYSITPRELARQMAVVTQKTDIPFEFTVEEVVLMGRNPYIGRLQRETAQDYKIVDWALEVTKTKHLKDRLITELSGGECQRVVIARALAQEPRVLLLDEPTSHLDINYQIEIMDLLKDLNTTQNLTIIVVLHDLNLAAQYCDQLILLHQGKIYAAGQPEQVITEKNIMDVYNSRVIIKQHPIYKCPHVTLLAQKQKKAGNSKIKIHLVCGGGIACALMEMLVYQGYKLSVGTINVGDGDWEKARFLKIPMVEAPPFSPVTTQNMEKALKLMEDADVIVVANIPFGKGNFNNLLAVQKAQQRGKQVILIDTTPIGGKDYTGGKAVEIYRDLIRNGAKTVKYIDELFKMLDGVSRSTELNKEC